MSELYIVIGILLGLSVGIAIDRQARKDRDGRIAELEQELATLRNVVKSLDEDNVKLRRRLKKKSDDPD